MCELIGHITEMKITLGSACCLLHIANCTMRRYKRSPTRHFLNAAKMLMPRHWKSSNIPTIAELLRVIGHLQHGGDGTYRNY